MNPQKERIAEKSNPERVKGSITDALKGADVFLGLSTGGKITKDDVKGMAKGAIVFAMQNPIPEIFPEEAKEAGATVVATGRSDYPNQINNVLGFPGIFRGALDVYASDVNEQMMVAAAKAIASRVPEKELREDSDYLSDLHLAKTQRCDFHGCPVRQETLCDMGVCSLNPETCGMHGTHSACYTDHVDECLLALKARYVIKEVRNGTIQIYQPKNEGWQIQVEQ